MWRRPNGQLESHFIKGDADVFALDSGESDPTEAVCSDSVGSFDQSKTPRRSFPPRFLCKLGLSASSPEKRTILGENLIFSTIYFRVFLLSSVNILFRMLRSSEDVCRRDDSDYQLYV